MRQIQVDLTSTANGAWHPPSAPLPDNFSYPHLDKVLSDYDLPLTGAEFITTLTSLTTSTFCLPSQPIRGSWLDISTNYSKPRNYGWHRDSQLPGQVTLMLGFPPSTGYSGPDVFSHFADVDPANLKTSVEGEGVDSPLVVDMVENDKIREEDVIKPIYGEGREILVYRDDKLLHSAPDKTNRDGVWRFM